MGVICEWNDLMVYVCGFMFDKTRGETGQMVQVISEQTFRKVWVLSLVKSEVLFVLIEQLVCVDVYELSRAFI